MISSKHIFAVEYTIQPEQTSDGQTIVTESVRVTQKTYTQDWPAYNKAQTNEKTHFLAFLYELCSGIEEPVHTFGPPRLPLTDIVFSETFKTYSTVRGRRLISDLRDAKAKAICQRCRLTIRYSIT